MRGMGPMSDVAPAIDGVVGAFDGTLKLLMRGSEAPIDVRHHHVGAARVSPRLGTRVRCRYHCDSSPVLGSAAMGPLCCR